MRAVSVGVLQHDESNALADLGFDVITHDTDRSFTARCQGNRMFERTLDTGGPDQSPDREGGVAQTWAASLPHGRGSDPEHAIAMNPMPSVFACNPLIRSIAFYR